MSVILGTDGDDNLLGTPHGESFNSFLGHDTVDGVWGTDDLTINYGRVPVGPSARFWVVPNDGRTSYVGWAAVDDGSSGINFENIEKFSLIGTTKDDYFHIVESPTVLQSDFDVEGGSGSDELQLDVSAFSDSTFSVGSNGAITGNRGAFHGFEQIEIKLGGGRNSVTTAGGGDTIYGGSGANIINTGAGKDFIYSSGIDTVNGGAGFDFWSGSYNGSFSNLTFTYGATGAGTLSNSTSLAGIEQVRLETGYGNDTFNLAGSVNALIFANAGTNTLNVTGGGKTGYSVNVSSDGLGAASVSCNKILAVNIENVNITGSDAVDSFVVDGSVLSDGVHLNLDGGNGKDKLSLDLSTRSNTTFSVASNGAITTNSGTYSNFEQFEIKLGRGKNSVTTSGGDDIIHGGAGTNIVNTGAGNDYIYNGLGTDTVNGGSGIDYFNANGSSSGYTITRDGSGGYLVKDIDSSDGNHGTDHLTNVEYVAFSDTTVDLPVYGPTITGTSGNDVISDKVTVSGQPFATAFADTLKGLAGNDKLYGMGGDDLLWGGAGSDLLDGGSGNDTATYTDATAAVTVSLAVTTAQATGGAGSDTLASIENLIGSAFNDTLTGNSGANRLEGGRGNDILNGGANADTMIGGAGNDTYYVDNARDVVTELLNQGTDLVSSTITYALTDNVENLTLTGSANIDGTGNGLANTITGNTGKNKLIGGIGNDTLSGLAGNDTLDGGDGLDTLLGGDGNDLIFGGKGNDTLTGGAGIDTFNFLKAADNGLDKITDFVSGTDKLSFTGKDYGFAAGHVLTSAEFHVGKGSVGTKAQFIFNATTHALYFDADGSNPGAAVSLATLGTLTTIAASDIKFV